MNITIAELRRAAEIKDKTEHLTSELNSIVNGSAPKKRIGQGTRFYAMST